MTTLVAAAAVFLLIHLLISGTRLRDAITGAIGQGPYMAIFSLAERALRRALNATGIESRWERTISSTARRPEQIRTVSLCASSLAHS